MNLEQSSPRLRIGLFHVTPSDFTGGYERYARQLKGWLTPRGHVVVDVELPDWIARLAYLCTSGTVSHLPSSSERRRLLSARRSIQKLDVLYVKNDFLDLAVLWILLRTIRRAPAIVVGLHTAIASPNFGRLSRIRRYIYEGRGYVALIEAVATHIHALKSAASRPFKHRPVSVIPHALPAPVRPVRTAPGAPLRFLSVGRLCIQKGTDYLPGLARSNLFQSGTAKLTVAGKGELESLVASERDICFIGEVPESRPLMSRADCLLLPSRWEQLPLVLLEAIAEGLPYIVGPAEDLRSHALDVDLVMKSDDLDSLIRCCEDFATISVSESRYAKLSRHLEVVRSELGSERETVLALEDMFRAACDSIVSSAAAS